MSLVDKVEKVEPGFIRKHFRYAVDDAWKKLESIKLEDVYSRWLKVLDLIIEDNGGDRLVEAKRGKLYTAPSEEIESLDDDDDEEDPTNDQLAAEMDAYDVDEDDDDDVDDQLTAEIEACRLCLTGD